MITRTQEPIALRKRRCRRWLCGLVGRPSFQVMEWDEYRDPRCVQENVGYEFLFGLHAAHVDTQVGIYVEVAVRGAMSQHYGYPAKHWLLLVALGKRTFGVGMTWGRLETRMYDWPNKLGEP